MLIPVPPSLKFWFYLAIISSPSWVFSFSAMDFVKKTSGLVFIFLISTLTLLCFAGNLVLSYFYLYPPTNRFFRRYEHSGKTIGFVLLVLGNIGLHYFPEKSVACILTFLFLSFYCLCALFCIQPYTGFGTLEFLLTASVNPAFDRFGLHSPYSWLVTILCIVIEGIRYRLQPVHPPEQATGEEVDFGQLEAGLLTLIPYNDDPSHIKARLDNNPSPSDIFRDREPAPAGRRTTPLLQEDAIAQLPLNTYNKDLSPLLLTMDAQIGNQRRRRPTVITLEDMQRFRGYTLSAIAKELQGLLTPIPYNDDPSHIKARLDNNPSPSDIFRDCEPAPAGRRTTPLLQEDAIAQLPLNTYNKDLSPPGLRLDGNQRRGLHEVTLEDLLRFRSRGYTLSIIARELGVSGSTLKRLIRTLTGYNTWHEFLRATDIAGIQSRLQPVHPPEQATSDEVDGGQLEAGVSTPMTYNEDPSHLGAQLDNNPSPSHIFREPAPAGGPTTSFLEEDVIAQLPLNDMDTNKSALIPDGQHQSSFSDPKNKGNRSFRSVKKIDQTAHKVVPPVDASALNNTSNTASSTKCEPPGMVVNRV